MIYNTARCQEIFRNRFTGQGEQPFESIKKSKDIEGTKVDPSDLIDYRNGKIEDIRNSYYKALLSFSEGLDAVKMKRITWATIKLYYSIFYGLRCSLLCRNIVFLRAKNFLFYLKINNNESYLKVEKQNDHDGVEWLYDKLFGTTDFMCGQKIDGKNLFQWYKECRDIVNYKDSIFHEPNFSELWENIDIDQIDTLIQNYLQDRSLCCSADEAILAIPARRIFTVAQEIKNEGISNCLSKDQIYWMRNLIGNTLEEQSINKLIF